LLKKIGKKIISTAGRKSIVPVGALVHANKIRSKSGAVKIKGINFKNFGMYIKRIENLRTKRIKKKYISIKRRRKFYYQPRIRYAIFGAPVRVLYRDVGKISIQWLKLKKYAFGLGHRSLQKFYFYKNLVVMLLLSQKLYEAEFITTYLTHLFAKRRYRP
jgi:hypothetical protein